MNGYAVDMLTQLCSPLCSNVLRPFVTFRWNSLEYFLSFTNGLVLRISLVSKLLLFIITYLYKLLGVTKEICKDEKVTSHPNSSIPYFASKDPDL